MKQNFFSILIGLAIVLSASWYLYQRYQTPAIYEGLPTVPCFDSTEKVASQFSFTLHITINGSIYPLDSKIGHDAGNCLHEIFVKDASGTVYVRSNDTHQFTLGQFFDEWHKTFSPSQLFSYRVDRNHTLRVYVNKELVNTYRETLLTPNSNIEIIYE